MPLDPKRFREWTNPDKTNNRINNNTPKRSTRSTWVWISVFGVIVVGIIVVILLTPAP